MNVYDKAHELSRALKENKDVQEFKLTYEKIKDDKKSKKMLDDFRKIQFEAYSEQMKEGKISDGTMEKIQNLSNILSFNSQLSKYLQAEAKFSVLWEEILNILNEAVGLDLINKENI